MADAQEREIVPIEGLSADGTYPVQLAREANNVPQCGYCQAGEITQAAALLKHTSHLSDQQIVEAMSGNICRRGTYQAETTFGTVNSDVLADKDPSFRPENFCRVIRASAWPG